MVKEWRGAGGQVWKGMILSLARNHTDIAPPKPYTFWPITLLQKIHSRCWRSSSAKKKYTAAPYTESLLLQPVLRAAVLGQPSSLRPHWMSQPHRFWSKSVLWLLGGSQMNPFIFWQCASHTFRTVVTSKLRTVYGFKTRKPLHITPLPP